MYETGFERWKEVTDDVMESFWVFLQSNFSTYGFDDTEEIQKFAAIKINLLASKCLPRFTALVIRFVGVDRHELESDKAMTDELWQRW